MELFTPAWNSKHPEKRMDAVRKIKITDLEKLQKIAERTRYEDARQEVWKRIALEAKEWKVRQEAVTKITDEITLAKVALNDGDSDVRKTAMEKVRHPVLLAKIALSEIETLAEAEQHYSKMVSQISHMPLDSRLLTKAEFLSKVRGNCHFDVRRIAVKKVADQAVLAKLALEDSDETVRKTAAEGIIEQTFLKQLASKGSSSIRHTVVQKITDQVFLVEVASKDSDASVREAAVEKIASQYVLKGVALNDSYYRVRRAAVRKITDKYVLEQVAVKDTDYNVRKAAVEKITDQRFLRAVALKDSERIVSDAAVEKITDEEALSEIAKNAWNRAVDAQARNKADSYYEIEHSIAIMGIVARKQPSLLSGDWHIKPWSKQEHADNKGNRGHRDGIFYRDGEHSDERNHEDSGGTPHSDSYHTLKGYTFPPYPFKD